MRRFFLYFLVLAVFVMPVACTTPVKEWEAVSIYHWKLVQKDSGTAIGTYPFRNVYLHIMDIRWNAGIDEAEPKAYLNIPKNNALFGYPVIPVIYIENEVFTKMPEDSIPAFTAKLVSAKNAFQSSFGISHIKELQIDCDWLKSNKERYFRFLEELKRLEPSLILSATVRLYPFRYPDIMGVPPVDYGVLMCYNMDKIQSGATINSILNPDVLAQYLDARPYPVALKPALPVFGWYAWFKDGVYQNLLYLPKGFTENAVLKNIKDNNFRVVRDTVIADHYIRSGDILRNEFPTESDIQKSLKLIQTKLPEARELILYHWDDENTIQNYEALFRQIFADR